MAAPQTEQELLALLADRETALERIKRLQAEIAKGGFIPADQKRHNALLADRVRLLGQQQRIEADIRRANPSAADAVRVANAARDRLTAVREERRLLADRQRVDQAARAMDLRQRFGVAGGALAAAERFGGSRVGRAMGGGAMAAGAAIGGGARSGFQGTVEQNRLSYETTLMNRELAAAFKPLIDLFTTGVVKVRKFLESLGEGGQDALMYGGLAAGAYGLSRMGGRAMGGLAGMAMGGPLGGLAGMMMGGGGGGGSGAGGAMNMAALAGAASGGAATAGRGFFGRAVRSPLAKGVGLAALVGGVYAATPSSPTTSDEFRIRHGKNADALDALGGDTDAMQKRLKELQAGRTSGQKFYSAVGSIFGAPGQERDTIEELERRLTAKGVNPTTGKRRVTPDQFGYEEVGTAYRRASVGFLGQTPGDGSETPKAGGYPASAMERVAALLAEIARNTEKKPEVR